MKHNQIRQRNFPFSLFFFFSAIVIVSFLSIEVNAAAHPLYRNFDSPRTGFAMEGSYIVANSDSIIYRTGYYSINGSPWESFNLVGSFYRNDSNSNWLNAGARKSLPSFGTGEHYIILFGCDYMNSTKTWDCHNNRWQLITIKNTNKYYPPGTLGYNDKSDCGDILDYQCGTKTICNKSVNYGNCPIEGYSCIDNLCIAADDMTCESIICPIDEYCSRGVCLLNVTGKTYFVALWGNDNNSGNFTYPFATWQKSVTVSRPGDLTYIRGGIWRIPEERNYGMLISGPKSYNTGMNGDAQNPIRYFNYPGEKPIMDGEHKRPASGGWLYGLSIENALYISLKGLTIRHIHQSPPNFSNHGRIYSEVYGIGSVGANIHYENMVAHDIDGRGFQHWSSGIHDPGEPEHAAIDNTSWINCDAFNLFDIHALTPGNAADGFLWHGGDGNNYYFEGCRAWQYSDDGFNGDGQGHNTLKNCWAMATEKYLGLSDAWSIEGTGYKISGISRSVHPDYKMGEGGEIFTKVENSIAANCVGAGFINNLVVNQYPDEWPNNGLIYNNLAFQASGNFWDPGTKTLENGSKVRSTVYRNNIAYASTSCEGDSTRCYLVGIYYPSIYPHSNNTWIGTMKDGDDAWPGWLYNPAYNVTDEDFASLDYWQLTRPREPDGGLPDVDFAHLTIGSELIDGGTIIPGYHCTTAGEHPGETCRVWYGSAPDLGPFESNY